MKILLVFPQFSGRLSAGTKNILTADFRGVPQPF
jgi:hypothetical protein